MKKALLIAAALLLVVPSFAQKMTKEEKAAQAKAQYEGAKAVIEDKNWVIIPETYDTSSGIESNSGIDSFISCEKGIMYSQGSIVCANSYTNVSEPSEYTVTYDKKGNIKVKIIVRGNYWKGTYTISVRNNGNNADVIFNSQGGSTKKFSGPIVTCVGTPYNKRANPM